MKKIFALALVLVLGAVAVNAEDQKQKENEKELLEIDEYDNSFCKDPVELERWHTIVSNNMGNDSIQALHAMWIGLCVKVEAKEIRTNRANSIFNNAKDIIVHQIEMMESMDSNVTI